MRFSNRAMFARIGKDSNFSKQTLRYLRFNTGARANQENRNRIWTNSSAEQKRRAKPDESDLLLNIPET